MVTVLGHLGMLGSVVARRWAELGADDPGIVVNCIRPDDLALSVRLAETTRLIQPSTDAIDEDTDYARTKRLLERLPAVTIRSGLVDITRPLDIAYRNWRCNPLTPLEWADLAWDLRDHPGVHVAGREPLTRYEVARLVAEVWDRPQPIPAWSEVPLDRTQTPGSWPPLREALVEYREWLRS
jgi:uncharacterized protein YbjT (DUF2867 family)